MSFFSLIVAVPSPAVFVKILQGPSLSSVLFGQFRILRLDHWHRPLRPHSYLQRGDLINKPIFVTVDNLLKYRAICCCINR